MSLGGAASLCVFFGELDEPRIGFQPKMVVWPTMGEIAGFLPQLSQMPRLQYMYQCAKFETKHRVTGTNWGATARKLSFLLSQLETCCFLTTFVAGHPTLPMDLPSAKVTIHHPWRAPSCARSRWRWVRWWKIWISTRQMGAKQCSLRRWKWFASVAGHGMVGTGQIYHPVMKDGYGSAEKISNSVDLRGWFSSHVWWHLRMGDGALPGWCWQSLCPDLSPPKPPKHL